MAILNLEKNLVNYFQNKKTHIMLKKEEIVNGQLVYDEEDKTYGYIQDVGNSREKGDRGISSVSDDEYSYSVVDILTNEVLEGICEHSHMTSVRFSVTTQKDIHLYLAALEADATMALGKAKKYYSSIQSAINRFNKNEYLKEFSKLLSK